MNDPIEMIRGWISTGALVGLLTICARLWIQNRKLANEKSATDRELTMQEKAGNLTGLNLVIEGMGREIERLAQRVETLETEKEHDHNLIIELLRQMSRTQAVSILGSKMVSPALRRALEATIGSDDGELNGDTR